MGSWVLAALGLVVTAGVLLLAFGKLARDYASGLQTLSEAVSRSRPRRAKQRRLLDRVVGLPLLRWWLRNPVERASFTLSIAYLVRDRDMKLRVYPALAPFIVIPVIMLLQGRGQHGYEGSGFAIAFAGSYLGLVPLMGLHLLQYSQQWQACDVFRTAPIAGPAALSNGARHAVLLVFGVPLLGVYGLLTWLFVANCYRLLLLLPGTLTMPLFALIPCMHGKGIPLSLPTEEAKAAGRGIIMWGSIIGSMVLAGLAAWAWSDGWFHWFLIAETVVVTGAYIIMRASLSGAKWPPLE